jgi:hypothetical protein
MMGINGRVLGRFHGLFVNIGWDPVRARFFAAANPVLPWAVSWACGGLVESGKLPFMSAQTATASSLGKLASYAIIM